MAAALQHSGGTPAVTKEVGCIVGRGADKRCWSKGLAKPALNSPGAIRMLVLPRTCKQRLETRKIRR